MYMLEELYPAARSSPCATSVVDMVIIAGFTENILEMRFIFQFHFSMVDLELPQMFLIYFWILPRKVI